MTSRPHGQGFKPPFPGAGLVAFLAIVALIGLIVTVWILDGWLWGVTTLIVVVTLNLGAVVLSEKKARR